MQRCAAVLAEFLTAALHAAAGAKSGSGSGLLRLLRGRLLRGRLLGCRILLGLLRNRLLRGRILLGLLGRRSILRLLGLLGIGILIGLLGPLGIAALLIGIVLIGGRLDRNALICFFAESQQGDEDVGQENQSRRKAAALAECPGQPNLCLDTQNDVVDGDQQQQEAHTAAPGDIKQHIEIVEGNNGCPAGLTGFPENDPHAHQNEHAQHERDNGGQRVKGIPLHEAALNVLLSGAYSRFSSSAMVAGSSLSASKGMPLAARKVSSSRPSFSDMATLWAVSSSICASSAAYVFFC